MTTVRPLLVGMFVVLGSFALFWRTNEPATYNQSDSFWYVPAAQSLLLDGDFNLRQQYSVLIDDTREWNRSSIDVNGGRYTYYSGFGTAVFILPIVQVGNYLYREDSGLTRDQKIAALAARVMAAASVGLVFFVAWTLTRRLAESAALALVFAVATPHLSIHAGGLWAHNALLVCGLSALLVLARGGRWSWMAIVPLALGFYCRPTAAVPLALTFGWFLAQRRWSSAAAYAATGLTLLAAMVWQWHSSLGQWFPPYHAGQHIGFPAAPGDWTRILTAFTGHLVSPNRGLFLFMPIAVFSAWGATLALSRRTLRGSVFGLMGAWVAAHWIVIGLFPQWWLGHSFGPRAWAELTGALVLLLLPVWSVLQQGPRPWRRTVLSLACVLVLMGAFVNVRGGFCTGMRVWNAVPLNVDLHPDRVWDWGDLQFMRGSCGGA